MKKCYYYVATIFDSNPSGVIDGVLSTKDEHFPVAEQMRFLAEQRGISHTNQLRNFALKTESRKRR
jgi:hypothetical protein